MQLLLIRQRPNKGHFSAKNVTFKSKEKKNITLREVSLSAVTVVDINPKLNEKFNVIIKS